MEFRQIQTFLKLAQEKSFSKTARALGYSQSAVTVQIKHLEEELGSRLFDRIEKKVTLTHQGEIFIPHAESIIREIAQAKDSLKNQSSLSGRLRIGAVESLCISKMPQVLQHFYLKHPNVQVELMTGSPEELIQMMEHGQADIIYVLDRPLYDVSWIKALEVEEEIVFVSAADAPVTKHMPGALAEILGEKFFLTEKEANYRKELDAMLAARNHQITPFLEFGNPDFLLKLVEDGMGLTFLPWFFVEDKVGENRLAILHIRDFHLSMWRQVLYHKDKWVSPEMNEFIHLISNDG